MKETTERTEEEYNQGGTAATKKSETGLTGFTNNSNIFELYLGVYRIFIMLIPSKILEAFFDRIYRIKLFQRKITTD